ncbi:microfibrillar-associated protein MfaP1 [Penicillium riverlandense]|uniref:microfibrillar-associated protein MfaP1 n=1 Tax=Penicillium riverlandense TaxID=1903569 RepID=UPI00254676F5|nr:microfibrillar-associated protein MfaP1 [Penicillium riverlandense]KAJ5832557.1 microfibrillar-associated protein MfaP1 [Penicillium riverlandense]
MPPPLPSDHRGMTANPLKPVGRYRPGKPVAAEESSSEEEEEDDAAAQQEQERRRQAEAQRRKQRAPAASSFPAGAAGKISKGVQNVRLEEDEDEEGFVTDEEEDEPARPAAPAKSTPQVATGMGETTVQKAPPVPGPEASDEEEEEEEEESSEEESSSEDEAPRRVLLRPTFIKKDKRGNAAVQATDKTQAAAGGAESTADEVRRAQRQEKADNLVRDQLEKDAIARTAAHRAWDDDELVEADEEGAIDDRDGADPEAEFAAWKLRELKRLKREREAIEEAEKEREEIERRRNLTAEERDREDREFLANQQEEREANRGQTGFMQRYFHKGAFFRDDQEREGLDQRNLMGRSFVDDVNRETLPQYMQVRDMTKLGKKGRTRYRDLKSEDTGRFGDGFDQRSRGRRDGPPVGVTDERFMPDRGDDRGSGPTGPTGANASVVRSRRRSSSRSRSPRQDRHERSRSRARPWPDQGSHRKRSPSPYDDREKRRRVDPAS